MQTKENSNYSEMLRHENEITRLKIQAECGIMIGDNNELNPAVENIWLNQILEYERAVASSEKIRLGDYLGKPVFKPVEEINDNEITGELQKLMELMLKKNIVVESVEEVNDREMYRFITQELFQVETESNYPKNMIVCYIYEEFHPSEEEESESD